MKTTIEFEAVTKRFGKITALHKFSYRFAPHKITAIVGRSGSGKTTLLQLINGLQRPSRGQVKVFDAPIRYDDLPALRRQIGYAVQGTGLFPHMTVAENIQILGKLTGWRQSERDQRSQELLQLLGLPSDFGPRFPHELSGGQQQRVGLGRAMFLDPDIFLLDEAFGALDPITRHEIHEEFLHIQKRLSRTIVLVTHDMREAMKLADRIIILESGRLLQEGAPKAILANPATPFVRELIHAHVEM